MTARITIVDDSDFARQLISAALKSGGFKNLTSFADPQVALEQISSASVETDLFLLDIMMPHIDGIELCAHLRQVPRYSDTPVVMLTSRDDMESLSAAFVAGANDYLTKPFEQIELIARIRNSLRLKTEIERRKERERDLGNFRSHSRNMPGKSVGNVYGLCGAATFEDIISVANSMLGQLGLIACRIDGVGKLMQPALSDHSDRTVSAVSSILSSVPGRVGDVLTYWGDGVFCLATNFADPEGLQEQAEAMRLAVEARCIPGTMDTQSDRVTVSLGVALCEAQQSSGVALADAIRAAQAAAKAGGNRVTGWPVQKAYG